MSDSDINAMEDRYHEEAIRDKNLEGTDHHADWYDDADDESIKKLDICVWIEVDTSMSKKEIIKLLIEKTKKEDWEIN
tara:strand:+ start:5763 stop:5996 length:234 start_codon:yes stop_codon:yes gene_type:complete